MRGQGVIFHGCATGRRPFDAAEDEGSGCETLCGFVGRRLLGVNNTVCHTSRGGRSVGVRVVVSVLC
jgi:hypothetical protein